jgi:hypothetical protein
MKGTARPAEEGGFYVKFPTMEDGLRHQFELIDDRRINVEEEPIEYKDGADATALLNSGHQEGEIITNKGDFYTITPEGILEKISETEANDRAGLTYTDEESSYAKDIKAQIDKLDKSDDLQGTWDEVWDFIYKKYGNIMTEQGYDPFIFIDEQLNKGDYIK